MAFSLFCCVCIIIMVAVAMGPLSAALLAAVVTYFEVMIDACAHLVANLAAHCAVFDSIWTIAALAPAPVFFLVGLLCCSVLHTPQLLT